MGSLWSAAVARPALVAVLVLLTLAGPSPALADDGVTVDPGSPSAKEYSVPLDSARQAASGSSTTSSATPQRFGRGVTTAQAAPAPPAPPASAKATKKPRKQREAKPAATSTATTATAATTAVARPPKPAASVAPAATGGGTSPALALGGGAAIVLLVGGAVGVWLRRRPAGVAR